MQVKGEERKPQRGGGGGKKRKPPIDGGEGGWGKKRKGGGEGGEKEGGSRKRLDALSVGYFRRVGERLSEGFEDDEEKGEKFVPISVYTHYREENICQNGTEFD